MSQRLFANYKSVAAATLIATGVLTACGPEIAQAKPAPPHRVAQNEVHAELGRVTQVQAVTTAEKPTGAGAVLGGVVGGVLGHQIGGGSGRSAATAVGVAGGALAGHALEKERANKSTVYRVTVRTDTGHTRVFEAPKLDGLKVGSRVRVDGGVLRHA
jgi:outer membrane lipoprotein SlyB